MVPFPGVAGSVLNVKFACPPWPAAVINDSIILWAMGSGEEQIVIGISISCVAFSGKQFDLVFAEDLLRVRTSLS